MNKHKTNLIWWLHFVIVLVAFGLFFVPSSIWPSKVTFHFFYLWGIIALQFLSGVIYYPFIKKFLFVCPLTELEAYTHDSYSHEKIGQSCIGNFCHEKLGLPYRLGTISIITALIIVTIQFFNLI